MPPHSISINTPTNARIREIVQNLEQSYAPEPDRFIYGGGRSSEYSQPGNQGSYPPVDMLSVGGGPKKKMRRAGELKDAFDTGLSSVLNPVSKTLKPVAKLAKTMAPLAPLLLALGEGDMKPAVMKRVIRRKMIEGGNVKKTAKKSASRVIDALADKAVKKLGGRASARGAIVKQVMAEHGLSLPKASAYVKQHGLY
jgi:hypothetical protein